MHTSARNLGGVGLPRFARNDGSEVLSPVTASAISPVTASAISPVIASEARQSIFVCQKPTINLG